MIACHPDEKDEKGNPRRDLWPPQDGTTLPTDENNPIQKLLWMSVTPGMLEDDILVTNRINIHRCSNYCLQLPKTGENLMHVIETKNNQGKPIRNTPVIIRDKKIYLDLKCSETILLLYNIHNFILKVGELMVIFLLLFQKAIQKTPLLMRLLLLKDMFLVTHVKEISLQVLWLNFSMIWPTIKMNVPQLMQKVFAPNF